MDTIKKILLALTTLSVINGCAIAPYSGPTTAQSVGKGNFQTATSVLPVPAQSIAYGLTDNTDIGALIEMQMEVVSSIWVKHQMSKKNNPHRFALLAGAYMSDDDADSKGYYLGPIWSYQTGQWEPYTRLRYNYVDWKGYFDLDSHDRDDLSNIFKEQDHTFSYLSLDTGTKYHFTDTFSIGFGLVSLYKDELDVGYQLNFTWNL
ncbi:hypothetical protein [Algicola sagamiensis]|uniref:hypothetical protein n=1 Tax=Algicola sagamiensis TaxID=163869 RepID=UPI0003688106|nr:hypothetical protein [Algicola sagamiensis]